MMKEILSLLLFISASVYGDKDDDYNVESISDTQYKWSLDPFWDVSSQTLYFTDLLNASIISYKPSTKEFHSVKISNKPNTTVSMIIPFEGEKDKYVITVNNTVRNWTWDGSSNEADKPVLVAELGTKSSIYAFVGKADPMGRLWIGTIGTFHKNASNVSKPDLHVGEEYMITANAKVVTKISNISIPDGVAWNKDRTKFYFVNSLERKVEAFDYDNESGNITNRTVIFDTNKNNLEGYPSGMTIDTEGKLWIALFFNGTVIRIDPETGKLLRKIHIPAREPASLAFGGKNLDVLYVTSAQIVRNIFPPTKYSGRVFAVTGLMSTGKPVTGYAGQKIVEI